MTQKTQSETLADKAARLSPHHSPEREDRVAAALRENLRKRKAQTKAQMQTRVASQNEE